MKLKPRATLALLLLGLVTPASSHEVKRGDLQIVHPWVRGLEQAGTTAPRDVSVAMTMFNRGIIQDRLISVSSPLAASGEIRLGGQSANAIAVVPGGPVAVAEVGTNSPYTAVVLHGVTDDLGGYETFPVWLTFERAGRIEVAVFVEEFNVKNPSCSGSVAPEEMHTHDHAHAN